MYFICNCVTEFSPKQIIVVISLICDSRKYIYKCVYVRLLYTSYFVCFLILQCLLLQSLSYALRLPYLHQSHLSEVWAVYMLFRKLFYWSAVSCECICIFLENFYYVTSSSTMWREGNSDALISFSSHILLINLYCTEFLILLHILLCHILSDHMHLIAYGWVPVFVSQAVLFVKQPVSLQQ